MSKSLLSNEIQKRILYYYKELFENYERRTTPEICDELGISAETLRKFLHGYCAMEESEINKIGLIILLSTKFGPTSPFREMQNKYKKEIEHREKIRMIKDKIRINNNLIEQRSKTNH